MFVDEEWAANGNLLQKNENIEHTVKKNLDKKIEQLEADLRINVDLKNEAQRLAAESKKKYEDLLVDYIGHMEQKKEEIEEIV